MSSGLPEMSLTAQWVGHKLPESLEYITLYASMRPETHDVEYDRDMHSLALASIMRCKPRWLPVLRKIHIWDGCFDQATMMAWKQEREGREIGFGVAYASSFWHM